jgi:hypothetical protein
MKQAELDRKVAAHEYTVYHPDGAIFSLVGVMGTALIDGSPELYIRGGQQFSIIDPRCVITRKEGVVWEPHEFPGVAWLDEWLKDHPEWPPHDLRIIQHARTRKRTFARVG